MTTHHIPTLRIPQLQSCENLKKNLLLFSIQITHYHEKPLIKIFMLLEIKYKLRLSTGKVNLREILG
jgi:hypothetical protein